MFHDGCQSHPAGDQDRTGRNQQDAEPVGQAQALAQKHHCEYRNHDDAEFVDRCDPGCVAGLECAETVPSACQLPIAVRAANAADKSAQVCQEETAYSWHLLLDKEDDITLLCSVLAHIDKNTPTAPHRAPLSAKRVLTVLRTGTSLGASSWSEVIMTTGRRPLQQVQ